MNSWLMLVVYLLALAIVAYAGQAVLKGINAAPWVFTVGAGLLLLVALALIAHGFGIA